MLQRIQDAGKGGLSLVLAFLGPVTYIMFQGLDHAGTVRRMAGFLLLLDELVQFLFFDPVERQGVLHDGIADHAIPVDEMFKIVQLLLVVNSGLQFLYPVRGYINRAYAATV